MILSLIPFSTKTFSCVCVCVRVNAVFGCKFFSRFSLIHTVVCVCITLVPYYLWVSWEKGSSGFCWNSIQSHHTAFNGIYWWCSTIHRIEYGTNVSVVFVWIFLRIQWFRFGLWAAYTYDLTNYFLCVLKQWFTTNIQKKKTHFFSPSLCLGSCAWSL